MKYACSMEKSCIFVAKTWQSGGSSRHDVRESGESPGLYLQL